MKKIFSFLVHKWTVALIGLTAIAVLIWIGGPYLGFGDSRPLSTSLDRLVSIVVAVALWVVNNLRLQAKSSRANSALIAQLAASPPAEVNAPGAEEVAVLKERFDQAMERLKKAHFHSRFGKQYLYELPWYVIIGPPGVGKTTLLANSGLQFPLADQLGEKTVRGVGGTRNCDWWFTNEAVLLDTAGRYTTQDSHREADSGAWLGFLELLSKHRRRRPLNGIILAISIADVMLASEQERALQAQTVRQRIQELYKRLGLQLPIYLVFTKCDLVAGFMEFFDDLDKTQREQVWGLTFTQDAAADFAEFGREFNLLIERLGQRMLWRLQQERDLTRRGLIHAFPQQMADLKPLLEEFLKQALAPSRFEECACLRGVYFTSGTQEGSPIDRVMAALTRSFSLRTQSVPAFTGRPRAYFVTALLRDVIFPEAELVGANTRYEKQRRWLQGAVYAAAVVITFGVVFAWSASFTRNELTIAKLNDRLVAYREVGDKLPTQARLVDLLTALDRARDITQVYGSEPRVTPWLMGMGLYQGTRLGSAAERAYAGILQHTLLPHIKNQLELRIRSTGLSTDDLRALLSLYLMLGDPATLDHAQLGQWTVSDWERSLPQDIDTRQRLGVHLGSLLKTALPAQMLDKALMARATQFICEIPLVDQVYERLRRAAESAGIAGFSLASLGSAATSVLTLDGAAGGQETVPGFFTYSGYDSVLDKQGEPIAQTAIEENLRVCEARRDELLKADAKQVLRDVKTRYFRDYISRWNAFLGHVQLAELRSASQANEALKRLSGSDSPLRALLKSAADNTTLSRSALASMIKDKTPFDTTLLTPPTPVDTAFATLHRLVAADKDQPAQLDSELAKLAELGAYVADIAESSEAGEAAFQAAKARMTQSTRDVIAQLRRGSASLPAPLQDIFASAATQSWGVILGTARSYLDGLWRASVWQPYRDSLYNRYPLYATDRQQATLADFGRFFGVGGTLDHFVGEYLQPFIDTQRWRERVVDQRRLGISAETLNQLQRAAEIRAMYFADGGQRPLIRFTLRPAYLDAQVSRFNLELNGQFASYRHDPERTIKMEWPGPEEGGRVRIVFERLNGGSFSLSKDGPWAWFRLLDDASVSKSVSANVLQVTFETAGLKMRYELRASSVANPFNNSAVNQFRCPEHL
jgi:type VI secretion system protein ImpL